MTRDVWYVAGCAECAMAKTPRQLPAGKLLPLPVAQRPWSNLGIDYPLPAMGRIRPKLSAPTCHWTPFQCTLGYQPPLFPSEPSNVVGVEDWYRESVRVWSTAHCQLQRAVRRYQHHADVWRGPTPSYEVGQKVWLSTRDIRLRLPSKKLSPQYIAPFEILQQVNPVTFKLRLPTHYRIHPTFHVSLLKPYHAPYRVSPSPPECDAQPVPPLPLQMPDGSPGVPGGLGGVRSGGALVGPEGRHLGPRPAPGLPRRASGLNRSPS
ncbi:hypothetical protein ACEWY4_016139 [Coilia grayii]|uniref:Tf2-1-like SH3-like domain-containing protein n=1 Tax=Coilia grayii TaxID=363190 RepID=A0ABD1JQX6_9TELE